MTMLRSESAMKAMTPLADLESRFGHRMGESEQDPAIAIPLTYAKMGCDYLRDKSVAAGLAA